MSKFVTEIPVDVDAVKAKLPARAFVHSVTLSEDKRAVLLEWDCDTWTTPYTVAVPISVAMLEGTHTSPGTVVLSQMSNDQSPMSEAGCRRVQNAPVAGKGKGNVKRGQ